MYSSCVGTIAYLGPVTALLRQKTIVDWIAMLQELHIPCTPHFSLAESLVDSITIRQWVSQEVLLLSLLDGNENVIMFRNFREMRSVLRMQLSCTKPINGHLLLTHKINVVNGFEPKNMTIMYD